MRNLALRGALAIPIGLVVGVMGRWEGFVIAAAGILFLGIGWRSRNRPPIDPAFLAGVENAMRLERTNPEAAAALLDSAIADADKREALVFAELRRRASTDRKAAVELRNRLRDKLETQGRARRKAEKSVGSTPYGVALLQEMDRSASSTMHELTQVEQYLADVKSS